MYSPHVVALMAGPNHRSEERRSNHAQHPPDAQGQSRVEPVAAARRRAHSMKPFARGEVAIPVKCNVHPWMKGYIAVFKHPYFAVTAKDGKFDLKNLPPGTYTIEAWQEKYGRVDQQVTIGPKESKTSASPSKPQAPQATKAPLM